jgi:hypothetical protein
MADVTTNGAKMIAAAEMEQAAEQAGELTPAEIAWNEVKARVVPFSMGADAYSDFTKQEATLEEVAHGFLEHVVQRKKGIGAVSGAVLKDYTPQNPPRKKDGFFTEPIKKGEKRPKNFKDENVAFVHTLLCYDLDNKDGQKTIEDAEARCKALGLKCNAYSTYSHTDEQEKARLVVYLKTPIPTATKEERVLYREFYRVTGEDICPGFDPSCCNPARVIYLPSYNGKTTTFTHA